MCTRVTDTCVTDSRKLRHGLHVDIPSHIFEKIKKICRKRGITITALVIRLLILAIKEDNTSS